MKKLFALFSLVFAVLLFQATPVMAGGAAHAKKVVEFAKSNSWKAQKGYKGGSVFKNKEGRLPLSGDNTPKSELNFKEYDVNPLGPTDRDAERVVIAFKGSSFYKAYYTSDHYGSFTEIK